MYFLPAVPNAIALLNLAGFRVIVVSNQRCVARGLLTARALESMHQRMCDALARAGGRIDAVYYCPHEVVAACNCRKPKPGMLLEAARGHDIDLAASWMIGDSDTDVEAGKNAGCKTIRLVSSTETAYCNADVVAPSLLDATHRILQREEALAVGGSFNPQSGSSGSTRMNSSVF
jgi:D-glycero-D-manno-heptose 1,7-bisphosphate phosphatase